MLRTTLLQRNHWPGQSKVPGCLLSSEVSMFFLLTSSLFVLRLIAPSCLSWILPVVRTVRLCAPHRLFALMCKEQPHMFCLCHHSVVNHRIQSDLRRLISVQLLINWDKRQYWMNRFKMLLKFTSDIDLHKSFGIPLKKILITKTFWAGPLFFPIKPWIDFPKKVLSEIQRNCFSYLVLKKVNGTKSNYQFYIQFVSLLN